MKPILLTLPLLTLTSAFHSRKPSHTPVHQLTEQCCKANNGTFCGKWVKNCCKGQCLKGYFWDSCENNQELEPHCDTCLGLCKAMQGVPCSVSLQTGEVECCEAHHCVQPEGGFTDNTIDLVTTVAQFVLLHHEKQPTPQSHKILDMIGQKLMGKDSQCIEGMRIELPKCEKDTRSALISAKLFG